MVSIPKRHNNSNHNRSNVSNNNPFLRLLRTSTMLTTMLLLFQQETTTTASSSSSFPFMMGVATAFVPSSNTIRFRQSQAALSITTTTSVVQQQQQQQQQQHVVSSPYNDDVSRWTTTRRRTRRRMHSGGRSGTTTALQAGATSSSHSSVYQFPALPRLTREEEESLLRRVSEARRISALELDLDMAAHPRRRPYGTAAAAAALQKNSLVMVRAEAAGYGHDWEGYEQAKQLGFEARNTLVTRNMGLVYYCVSEIMKRQHPKVLGATLSKEDLVQEGVIGLARAVDKYNIGIGGKFSTYAVYWIRAAVLRCIAEKGHVVRVPEHVSAAIRKMTAAANRLGWHVDGESIVHNVFLHTTTAAATAGGVVGDNKNNNNEPWKEAQAAKRLAEEAGLTDRQLRQAMKIQSSRRASSVSLEDWMQKGEHVQADINTMASSSLSSTTSVDSEKLRHQLSKFLRPQEMEALSLRYGLHKESSTEEAVEAAIDDSALSSAASINYLAEAEALLFPHIENNNNNKQITTPTSTTPTTSEGLKKSGEMTFAQVGSRMSVSAEYGRRLVHNAIAKLQKAAQEGQLEHALLF